MDMIIGSNIYTLLQGIPLKMSCPKRERIISSFLHLAITGMALVARRQLVTIGQAHLGVGGVIILYLITSIVPIVCTSLVAP